MKTIEERMAAVEKGLRRWRLMAISLTVGLVCLVVGAAGPAAESGADAKFRSLSIIDGDGKAVIRLQSSPNGGAITINPAKADSLAKTTISTTNEGGMIAIHSARPNAGFDAYVQKDGSMFGINNGNGKAGVKIFSSSEGYNRLFIVGPNGDTVWQARE